MATEPLLAEKSISLLSQSEKRQSGLAGFTHSLDKPGGNCSFLTETKQCSVQSTAKPSMCKLFPYTFLHCPDGLKVGLSFASTGVLLNQGKLLIEQKNLLEETRVLFESMHEEVAAACLESWQRTEFVAGALLDYADFCDFSAPYLDRLEKLITQPAQKSFADSAQIVLGEMCDVLCKSLPAEMLTPLGKRFPDIDSKKLDQYILLPLYRAYFASAGPVVEDEIALAVMTYLQNPQKDVYIVAGGQKLTFDQIAAMPCAPYSEEEQDLINRFVYMRLFTRFYFGPGFCMLPLLSGIFHLSALIALIPVALKIDSIRRSVSFTESNDQSRFESVLSLVRNIDRRLAAVIYSRNTASMFELFALDSGRLKRFWKLSN